MFGRASSRPIQKLEADPGIAIVPYEALSKGTPRNEEKSLTQLVGGNAQLVGRKAIAFSCSEPWEFPSRCGVTGVLWRTGQRRPQSWPSSAIAGQAGVEAGAGATPVLGRTAGLLPDTLPKSKIVRLFFS
jgi:hypothetical protein